MLKLQQRILRNSLEEKDYDNDEQFARKRELKSSIIGPTTKLPDGFIHKLKESMENKASQTDPNF